MKIYVWLSLLAGSFLFVSCKKEEVLIPNRTIYVEVNSNDWTLNSTNNTYQAVLDMPEITSDVSERDAVQVYISLGDGLYEALPQVYGGLTYLYSYRPGELFLDVQTSDGERPIKLNSTMRVKIVIIPSEP